MANCAAIPSRSGGVSIAFERQLTHTSYTADQLKLLDAFPCAGGRRPREKKTRHQLQMPRCKKTPPNPRPSEQNELLCEEKGPVTKKKKASRVNVAHRAVNSSNVSSACSLRRGTEVLKLATAAERAIRGVATTGRATTEARTKVAEPRAARRRKAAEGMAGEIGDVEMG